jgi:Tol biopolymer transport system component
MIRGLSLPAALAAFVAAAGLALAGTTERVSIGAAGQQGNDFSGLHCPSIDGRYVVFESNATNLVPNDSNGSADIFVRDRQAATTILVSVSSAGVLGDGDSVAPCISGNGRWVVFASLATNLVADDTNGRMDVFVHDVQTGETTRASLGFTGFQTTGNCTSPVISDDGRIVAFVSDAITMVPDDTNSVPDIFVRDRGSATTHRLSVSSTGAQANGTSDFPSLSSDGRFVAFSSLADNLVPGDTNQASDVFVHDRQTGETVRVSVDSAGAQGNERSGNFGLQISANGRFVTFSSEASNLVAGDTNNRSDIFVRDRLTGETTRVSVSSTGEQAVAPCILPTISGNGRMVAFESFSRNLVPNDTNLQNDIFLHDRQTGETTRVSVLTGGTQAPLESRFPRISASGRIVTYKSLSAIAPDDTNLVKDVYLHDIRGLALAGLSPASGSESGGELLKIDGCGFTNAADTSVLVGGAAATVVSVGPRRVSVRTPAGAGGADVTVVNQNGSATLPAAYTYVDPVLAARYGNVNVARGNRADVLLVNGGVGDPTTRELFVAVGQPVTVQMIAAPGRAVSRFVLYAWNRVADASTLSPQPFGLGTMVYPTPLGGGAPQPVAIFNNVGRRAVLGAPTHPSSPAPSNLGTTSFPIPRAVTLQGFIEDDGAQIPQGMAITNAVIVRAQ